jgi:hypothetical protein
MTGLRNFSELILAIEKIMNKKQLDRHTNLSSKLQPIVDKLEVLEDIKLAEKQISRGRVISHQAVKEKFSEKSNQ